MREETDERRRVEVAVEAVQQRASHPPVLGLILLDAGHDRLAETVDVEAALPYERIPHFARAARGKGTLLLGTLGGTATAVLHGRPAAVGDGRLVRAAAFPVRVLATLGVEVFLLFGAAVSLRSDLQPGEAMGVTDHLNLLGENPLVGPNVEEWGPRFPDMTAPYDATLREQAHEQAQEHAREHDVTLRPGVLAAVPGPVQITSAEGRMLRALGADAVGASVVPEVIAARHMERRVGAAALITSQADGNGASTTDEDPQASADEAASKLIPLVGKLAGALG